MAYPLAAFVVGLCAERGLDRRWITSIVAMLAGLAVIYTGGMLWLAFFAARWAPGVGGRHRASPAASSPTRSSAPFATCADVAAEAGASSPA